MPLREWQVLRNDQKLSPPRGRPLKHSMKGTEGSKERCVIWAFGEGVKSARSATAILAMVTTLENMSANYHGSGNDYTINSPTIIVV